MKWKKDGEPTAIKPMRPEQTVVELKVELPDQSYIPGGVILSVRMPGAGIEGMNQVERDWALRHLIETVVDAAINELEEEGVLRGGS